MTLVANIIEQMVIGGKRLVFNCDNYGFVFYMETFLDCYVLSCVLVYSKSWWNIIWVSFKL